MRAVREPLRGRRTPRPSGLGRAFCGQAGVERVLGRTAPRDILKHELHDDLWAGLGIAPTMFEEGAETSWQVEIEITLVGLIRFMGSLPGADNVSDPHGAQSRSVVVADDNLVAAQGATQRQRSGGSAHKTGARGSVMSCVEVDSVRSVPLTGVEDRCERTERLSKSSVRATVKNIGALFPSITGLPIYFSPIYFSPIPTRRGSGLATRTPTDCYASTSSLLNRGRNRGSAAHGSQIVAGLQNGAIALTLTGAQDFRQVFPDRCRRQ